MLWDLCIYWWSTDFYFISFSVFFYFKLIWNQSWIFIGMMMLKLKLQYSGHLTRRTDSLEKTLMLGKTEGRRRRGWDGWMASPTQWTWVWVNSWSWWWTGRPGMQQSMGLQRVGHNWVTELNWTENKIRGKTNVSFIKRYRGWSQETWILILFLLTT